MSIILFLHQTFRDWSLWKMHQYTRRGLEDTFSPETISIARNLQPRHFQPPDTFSHEGERHFQPWDTFSCNNFSPETIAALRNFQPGDTFSPETLAALRIVGRHFQPRDNYGLETLSASRNFSLKIFSASRNFKPFFSKFVINICDRIW